MGATHIIAGDLADAITSLEAAFKNTMGLRLKWHQRKVRHLLFKQISSKGPRGQTLFLTRRETI